MKNSYNTLVDAIKDLQEKGYTVDFNLHDEGLESKDQKKIWCSDDLEVVKYYRFEGMTSPDDSSILYVIETRDSQKGLLVDSYGATESNVSPEMIKKLRITHRE